MEKSAFANRLAELRIQKGISARDMSLSLGQSPGYINNIENGVNYPSMASFFYICDYLGVTPKDFFDTDQQYPTKIQELLNLTSTLSGEQIDLLITLAKGIQ